MTERRGPLAAAAVLLALAVPAVLAWSRLLDGVAVALAPLAALALTVLAGRRPARRATAALVVWLLAAPLLARVPLDQLAPRCWTALPARLAGGALGLADPGVATSGADPWPLAAGLLLAGAAWIPAAALARRRAGLAFAVGAGPWLAAALLQPARASVLQGAAVLLAGLLWHAWPRTPGRATVVLSVAVALTSAIAAQAIAPRHRWLDLPGSDVQAQPPFRLLQTEPTFQSLADRRTGAPMLEIRAPQPAFWRMQVLDVFDGYGWRTSWSAPALPEPAARRVRIDVRVRGLRNDLVASPGAIDRVESRGRANSAAGGAWRLTPQPRAGDAYRVHARIVRARADQLRRAAPPRDPRIAPATRLGWGRPVHHGAPSVLQIGPLTFALGERDAEPEGFPIDVPAFGTPPDAGVNAALDASPYRGVAALARRLAAGAGTEWKVVARVMHYLRDEGRFRYTTEVVPPGAFPLADFLLHTRAGYCQHFAGAAALLLRLAGVPARMVAGFATGVRSHGRFEVRDTDAHDWIEVYFTGYGWVPFNPTPAVAPAAIPQALDLLGPADARGRGLGSRAWALLGVLAAVALSALRRRRPPQLGDALGRLLGRPVPPSTTLGRLADELARTLGPHTAALATEAERARFAPGGAGSPRWTRARIARALARDVGPWRAALLLAGAAAAGARASHRAPPDDLA